MKTHFEFLLPSVPSCRSGVIVLAHVHVRVRMHVCVMCLSARWARGYVCSDVNVHVHVHVHVHVYVRVHVRVHVHIRVHSL